MEKPSPNIPPSCPVRLPFEKATGWGDSSSSSGCQSQVSPSIPLGWLGGGRQKGKRNDFLCLPLGVKDSLNHRKEGGSGACAHYLIFSLWDLPPSLLLYSTPCLRFLRLAALNGNLSWAQREREKGKICSTEKKWRKSPFTFCSTLGHTFKRREVKEVGSENACSPYV